MQVRRNALGGRLNFDVYRKRRIIIRNDCQSGLYGSQTRGSRSATFLPDFDVAYQAHLRRYKG